jgi:2-isopropylmalate synthase
MAGQENYQVADGDGPINAIDAALRKALVPFYPHIDAIRLEDYKVRIINGRNGSAARTRVHITSTDGQHTWSTVGVSDNVIQASWLALVDSFDFRLGRSGADGGI